MTGGHAPAAGHLSARGRHGTAREWWRAAAVDGAPLPERPGRIAFPALAAYTVILVAAPQDFIAGLGPLRIALVTGVVALAAHARDRWAGRIASPRWPVELRLVLCLLAWAVVMVPFSYWPGGSVAVLTNLYLKSIAVFVLLAGVIDTRRRLRLMGGVLVACAAVIAVTALRHFQTGTIMDGAPGRIAGYGVSPMAGNPNDLALLLNIIIPIDAALCLTTTRRAWKWLGLAVLAICVAAVVVTFSRAGFITLVVIAVLFLWWLGRRGTIGAIVAVAAMALVLFVLAPKGYVHRLATVSNIDADRTGSAQGRWRDMVVATNFVVHHPVIGAGAGMDYLALNQVRGNVWLSVHNVYLNYAVDLGVVGLGLFLAVFGRAFRGVRRVERERAGARPPDALGVFATGLRISLTAFAIEAFFHPIAYHAFFYYLAGLAVATARIDRHERELS
jgi:O-antigen ligase